MKVSDQLLGRRRQYAAYLVPTSTALVFTVILLPSSNAYFRRFFGETNAIVVGAVALWVLQTSYQLVLLKGRATFRGVALSAAFATALGIAIVAADCMLRYPHDMNVPVPQGCCSIRPPASSPRSHSTFRHRQCCSSFLVQS